MKKNWIRNILGGLSLTSAMFIFQACYGTPQDFEFDIFVEGQVKSDTTGLPIEGIKVSVANLMQYEMTDSNGYFSFYLEMNDSLNIQFEDIDSTQNSFYENKDTILTNCCENYFLDILLEEK